MAASIGVEQHSALGSKLCFMNIQQDADTLRQDDVLPSIAMPSCRKPSLPMRRCSSSLTSSKNLRLSGGRLISIHLPASSANGQNGPSNHRLSVDLPKRTITGISGGMRSRRSVDDTPVMKRSSSIQQISCEIINSVNAESAPTVPSNQNSVSLRRAASAQNILCMRSNGLSNGHSAVQRKSSANAKSVMAYNAELLATFENEKKQLESRISELTQLTEKRKSEIERYKIELRQMAESMENHLKVQEENNSVRAENRMLREKLREISGGAFEPLTDTEKLSLLQQQTSVPAAIIDIGSGGSECGRTVHTPDHGSSCFSTDVRQTGGGGGHSIISGDTWDRHSCRSGGESDAPSAGLSSFALGVLANGISASQTGSHPAPTDVANLRDKIAMMEETNYSTNEELQATVQELVEMQKTVNELQEENERLADERAVLLASLCAQTQKLENCRVQIEHLKALLLSDGDSVDRSEYEQQLAELVKRGEEERDELLLRQAELSNALAASEYDLRELFDANCILRDRMTDQDARVSQLEIENRKKNDKITSLTDELQMKSAELERCRALLETERSRPELLGGVISQLPHDLESFRMEKVRLENRLVDVEERLAIANRELSRLREQLSNAQTATAELDAKLAVAARERASFEQELMTSQQQLDHLARAAESSQADLTSVKIRLDGSLRRVAELESELVEARRRHGEDSEEWRQFQRDLQMAVVVANNMCVETKEQLERLSEENVALQEQHRQLNQERARLLEENTRLRSMHQQSSNELAAAATMQRFRAASSATLAPGASNQQLSVKSLIRSIEAQVKAPPGTNTATAAAVALLNSHHHNLTSSPRRAISGSDALGSHSSSPSGMDSPVSAISTSRASPATNSIVSGTETPASCANSGTRPQLRKASSVSSDSSPAAQATNASNVLTAASLKPPRSAASANGSSTTPCATPGSCTPSAISSHCALQSLSTPLGVVASSIAVVANGTNTGESVIPGITDPASVPSQGSFSGNNATARLTMRGAICDLSKDPLTLLAKQMGGSKRNALLKWVQNRTQGYNRIEVTNFSSSWADGLAFCALLHSYLPDSVPYNQLTTEGDGTITVNERRRNFNIAFQVAEKVGVPRSLDIDEMLATERPDWQRIMSYVTAIYKSFELPDVVSVQSMQN